MFGIPVERARWRQTLSYDVSPRLRLGVEWNPLDEDVGPLANLRLLDETAWRPALVVGTSSARIGSEEGRAFYATLSKDLQRTFSLPLAPYAGITYDGSDDRWRAIGGLSVRYGDRVRSTHFYDGRNLHHLLDWAFHERFDAGVLLVDLDGELYGGLRFGVSLGSAQ